MHNVSGISGCGPIFRDVMLLLQAREAAAGFPEPEGIVRADVCPLSGLRPTESCPGVVAEVFVEGSEPRKLCGYQHRGSVSAVTAAGAGDHPAASRFEIAFPRDGDIFKLDPILRKEFQRIKLRAAVPGTAGISRVEWWVNGDKVGEAERPSFSLFWNLRPGSYTIKAKTVSNGSTLESPSIRVVVLS